MRDLCKLLSDLSNHAMWCDANEREIPITMGDDIREAISVIEHLSQSQGSQPNMPHWSMVGYESASVEVRVIWECDRCGYKRIAGWEAPHYACPECTGRKVEKQ